MTDIIKYNEQAFENIKHVNEYGQEFWLARELMTVLEYKQWRRFEAIIEKAKVSCLSSNNTVSEHFANVGKMIKLAKGAVREIEDFQLSRYACYLIAMNGDPRKKAIALAQLILQLKQDSRN